MARNTLPAHECPERLDGLRVLVVDDEPDARELLATGIGQYRRGALEAIAVRMFDVLFSDIGMPVRTATS